MKIGKENCFQKQILKHVSSKPQLQSALDCSKICKCKNKDKVIKKIYQKWVQEKLRNETLVLKVMHQGKIVNIS